MHHTLSELSSRLDIEPDPSFDWSPLKVRDQSVICCQGCRDMFSVKGVRALYSHRGYIHSVNPLDYRNAAERGCFLCQAVWNNARSNLPVAFFAKTEASSRQDAEMETRAGTRILRSFDTLHAVYISIKGEDWVDTKTNIRFGLGRLSMRIFTYPG